MKQSISLWALGIAAIAGFASCSHSNTQGRYIPEEAAIVVHVDGKSLSAKLPWEEVRKNALFQQVEQDSTTKAELKKLLENPENSGIDTKTDLIFFAVKDSLGGYVAFEGTIKNLETFKAFNKEITKGGSEQEKDGINYISKSPMTVGWNKERFIYLFDAPEMSKLNQLDGGYGDGGSIKKSRDLSTGIQQLFAIKESNTLAKESKFSALIKEPGDIHFWMNAEQLNKGAASNPMLAMINLDKMYKGSITTATFSFDNGKVNVDTKSYAGEELTKLYKNYNGGKISEDMLKRIPGTDVSGVMAFHFQPEAFKELFKVMGLEGVANTALQSYAGFSLDDFIKANKGDVVMGLSDFKMEKDSFEREKPSFNFVFAASIGDKDAFNKLINAGKKLGALKGSDDPSKLPIAYSSNGTYFALSNTQANADHYLETPKSNFDFISKINDGPFGGYLNIHSLLASAAPTVESDSTAKVVHALSIKMWDNLLWKGGEFKDNGIHQHMEINLMDKNQNSLKQLNDYANKISELIKAQKDKDREEMKRMMGSDETVPEED